MDDDQWKLGHRPDEEIRKVADAELDPAARAAFESLTGFDVTDFPDPPPHFTRAGYVDAAWRPPTKRDVGSGGGGYVPFAGHGNATAWTTWSDRGDPLPLAAFRGPDHGDGVLMSVNRWLNWLTLVLPKSWGRALFHARVRRALRQGRVQSARVEERK